MARRVCGQCGLDYNLIFHRPAKPDTCDVCGGPLLTRADDNAEALQKRLDAFHSKTKPTLELFEAKSSSSASMGPSPAKKCINSSSVA